MKTTTNHLNMTQLLNNLRVVHQLETGVTSARGAGALAASCVARLEGDGYVVADLLRVWGPHL